MLPSASLDAAGKGLYEPIHGSAPDIAGQDKANPLATILSLAMMFRYTFARADLADRIEAAVRARAASRTRTRRHRARRASAWSARARWATPSLLRCNRPRESVLGFNPMRGCFAGLRVLRSAARPRGSVPARARSARAAARRKSRRSRRPDRSPRLRCRLRERSRGRAGTRRQRTSGWAQCESVSSVGAAWSARC